jgi:hypothetical protein
MMSSGVAETVIVRHDVVTLQVKFAPPFGMANQIAKTAPAGRPVVKAIAPDAAAIYGVTAQVAQ